MAVHDAETLVSFLSHLVRSHELTSGLRRDDSALGKWSLKVGDVDFGEQDASGAFLGWSMTLWGTARDASRVVPWVVPNPSDAHAAFTQDIMSPGRPKTFISTSASVTSNSRTRPTDVQHSSLSPGNVAAAGASSILSLSQDPSKAAPSLGTAFVFSTILVVGGGVVFCGLAWFVLAWRKKRLEHQYAMVATDEWIDMDATTANRP